MVEYKKGGENMAGEFFPSYFLSKLVDSLFDKAKTFVSNKVERDRINDTVQTRFLKWAETREMAPLREELDLGGIAQYIEEGYVSELFSCCTELDSSKQEACYRFILEKLYEYSKADNPAKRFYVRQFADTTKDIVVNIASEYVDANTKIIISCTYNKKQPSTNEFSTIKRSSKSILEESVKRHKQNILKQPLISSVPERMSFRALIEKNCAGAALYVEPPISMRKSHKKYLGVKELFAEKKEEKLIVVGPAGSGKSTGLKALFLTNKSDTEVYYATIKEYLRKNSRSEMIHVMRDIVDGKLPSSDKLIVLDGLDEEFSNRFADAIEFIESILQSNAHIWIGCRENYYSKIAISLKENFDDIAVMERWDETFAKSFMTNYASFTNDSIIKERIEVLKQELAIGHFIITNPFFLTLFLFSIDQPDCFDTPQNEYDLFSIFLDRWIEAEIIRGTTNIEPNAFFHQLYDIANQLYSGNEPTYDNVDESIQGLLISRRSKVSGFIHWDFCVYLISRQIIEASMKGDLAIVSYYPQAFLDDVTNMTWEYLESLRPKRLQLMFNNLFSVYRQIYEPQQAILSVQAREQIEKMDKMDILKLKDEIIYFALRLPGVDITAFFDFASEQNRIDHPIIELGLAYGIGMRGSHPFALAFAQKLRPENPEAQLNRSWTVAFFGDQKAVNIYDFTENPVASWNMARDARMKRFQKITEKAYRFRLFDIPLLYCFYVSRDWTGCISEEDYEIIKNCDVDWPYYTWQEREFLREQKKQLVDDYRLFLDYQKSFG